MLGAELDTPSQTQVDFWRGQIRIFVSWLETNTLSIYWPHPSRPGAIESDQRVNRHVVLGGLCERAAPAVI
jgi:hypothetical protein